jgi:transposase
VIERNRCPLSVMIGVDPHKGSHTAVAIDAAERQPGAVRVRASAAQAGKLVEWAAEWPKRTWAARSPDGTVMAPAHRQAAGSLR